MIICTVYIFLGLAFTSTIIEIVRRQMVENLRKMQELRAQIQAQIPGPTQGSDPKPAFNPKSIQIGQNWIPDSGLDTQIKPQAQTQPQIQTQPQPQH